MRYKVYITLLLLVMAVMAVAVIVGVAQKWILTIAGVAVVVTVLLYISVSKPLAAVQNGIYLLREQDFTSRLRKVGQSDADKVVDLFNSLMATMKSERLKMLEQNNFLSLISEASPMGIAICDFDGNVMSSNKAYRQMLSPELEREINSLKEGETRIVRVDALQIYRCSRLWFMDSGFRRQFLLTERMTDEILQAEKAMFNTIVRTIGHEVNNTLGGVMSVLETLHAIHADDRYVAEPIAVSNESCMNLVRFVKGYADLVKLPEPSLQQLDLNEEMQRIMPFLVSMAHDGVKVSLKCYERPVVVSIDPMLMERVLVNIVKNALESIGDDKGSVTVVVLPRALDVVDSGRGISPDIEQRVFTPFFSTKRSDRGLGLMLVSDILRAHRATFTLTTDKLTRLTTFHIAF